MKKIYLLIIILFASSYSFGQSLQIVAGDTVLWCTNGSECDATCSVKNISGSSKNYMCYRTIIHLDSGDMNWICWGISCYPPAKDTSGNPVTIASEDTNSSFHGWLLNAGGSADDTVEYCFYDVNNPTDMTCFIAIYHFRPAGIVSIINKGFFNANIFPNPAAGNLKLVYSQLHSLDYEFIIKDITGRIVYNHPLNNAQEVLPIDVSNLNNGIYFWVIQSKNDILETGKIAIIK